MYLLLPNVAWLLHSPNRLLVMTADTFLPLGSGDQKEETVS